MFDTVIVVDWSAAASPSPRSPSPNAIWIGRASAGGVASAYHRTRHEAEIALGHQFAQERAAGRRVLVGFDFAFGYPQGFAARLTGRAGAAAVWGWLDAKLADGPDNHNDRFAVAAAINRRFGGAGPFWGRPASIPLADLPEVKRVDYPALGLDERRRVERAVPRAQPVWKLYTAGSVGGQVLTGMPLIHRLSRQPGVAVWPFASPGDLASMPLVLAEVYPSLIDPAVAAHVGIRDDLQVRLLAQALWRLGGSGGLAQVLADVPVWPGRADEGWILGAGQGAQLCRVLA